MTPRPLEAARWARIESLFHEALAAPESERSALLERRCESDQTLAGEVEALIAASHKEKIARAETQAPTQPIQRRFGAWEIDRLLGKGGMGAVYAAHRADGQFEQTVALKLLGAHLASDFFIARFVTERQILANLAHPNITRLLDGGVSAEGDPYLVMEYVEGEPVDRFCEQRGLPIRNRLELFLEVCSAVEYAHQSLVIHRDLKPGNILVTTDGTPKLLDFGTAKLLTADAADATLTGVALMTPRYASPEQLRGDLVNTLSDVYSLGVVLYELLAGRWPFGDPNSLVSGLERAVHGGEAEPLPGTIPGDLANIVMKAIQPDPGRRYQSVAQMSGDLLRFLDGRPVLARPQTAAYRIGKLVRRNKLVTAVVGCLAIAIVAGATATFLQGRRAQRRFQDLHKLANYLVFDLGSGLRKIPGSTPLQHEVVERSLEYLDRLAREASGDRELELELAEGYLRLGDVLGNPFNASLGERAKALDTYSKALTQVESVLAADARNRKCRLLAANIRLQIGGALVFGGKSEEGIAQLERVVQEQKALLREFPGDLDLQLGLAKALEFHATQLSQRGGMVMTEATAQAQVEEALAQLRQALRANPGTPRVLRQLAQTEEASANLVGSVDPVGAIAHYRQAITWLDQLPAPENEAMDTQRLRARIWLNVGWSLGQINAFQESLDAIAKGSTLLESLAAVDPRNTSAAYQLTGVYRTRGVVCGYAKMTDCAIESFEKAAAIHARLLKRDAANVTYRLLRGELLMRIADLLMARGNKAGASEKAAEGLRMLTALASESGSSASHAADACRWLATTEVKELRNYSSAVKFCEKAVAMTGGKDPYTFERLALAREGARDRKGAIEAVERALALIPPVEPGKPKSRQRIELEKTLAEWRR